MPSPQWSALDKPPWNLRKRTIIYIIRKDFICCLNQPIVTQKGAGYMEISKTRNKHPPQLHTMTCNNYTILHQLISPDPNCVLPEIPYFHSHLLPNPSLVFAVSLGAGVGCSSVAAGYAASLAAGAGAGLGAGLGAGAGFGAGVTPSLPRRAISTLRVINLETSQARRESTWGWCFQTTHTIRRTAKTAP